MSMLSGAQSPLQCHRAWCALHKLQTGRGGMHCVGEQTQKVSSPFPYKVRRRLHTQTALLFDQRFCICRRHLESAEVRQL